MNAALFRMICRFALIVFKLPVKSLLDFLGSLSIIEANWFEIGRILGLLFFPLLFSRFAVESPCQPIPN
ncbi:MAG: hypothetical protein NWE99_10095 [Candidatus Bathyarchaeota archaeon]|nr:hypothetical protein [Candidatus Bathyarchaeota archaeon]